MPAISARIRSASPRWLPSKRAGRCTLRMQTAADHADAARARRTGRPGTRTSPGGRATGSVASRSTAPIIAITIVGKRTRKPQKIAAWISPGTSRWSSLRWPSTISASLRARCGTSPERVGRLAQPDEVDEQLRAAREQDAADGERRREGERSGQHRYARARLPQLGGDRRHDLGQVADHGVVGAGEDRRLGVGVDREDLLRALAAGDVLRGAADAAGDVEVGRHLRAGLADLVGVRAPAGARDHARAADRARRAAPASSSRMPEAVGRADAAAAADHDLGLGERDAAGDRRRRARRPARPGRRRRARARSVSTAGAAAVAGGRRDGVRGDGQQRQRRRGRAPPRAGCRPSACG